MGSRETVEVHEIAVKKGTHGWLGILAALFARGGQRETVVTKLHFNTTAQTVWDGIRFYEEIPIEPTFLLRLCIPYPLRSEGKKTGPGSKVMCIYNGGDLVKEITSIDPPRLMTFEVHNQSLGMESCVVAQGGSYEIVPTADGVDVLLTTNYLGFLHPRFFFRPFERFMTHQLHLHILKGMKKILFPA
jgi:hypothetical protein